MAGGEAVISAAPKRHRSRKALVPWVLMAPGLLWLIVFFVLPNIQMFVTSLSTGSVAKGYTFDWAFQNYTYVLTEFQDNIQNSLVYGTLATTLCILIGYPMAYGIATRGGNYKAVLLFLVIAPFFTSFLIRTISWKIILGNDGPFLSIMRDTLGIVPENFNVLNTPLAVVTGLTYQYLPFFVLPAYVSIEKIDQRLMEAARDLYAGPWRPRGTIVGAVVGAILAALRDVRPRLRRRLLGGHHHDRRGRRSSARVVGAVVATLFISESFVRVAFPLSLPGVFAGTILVFIPIMGDYVNADLLGNPKTQMIGNVIQNRFLNQNDYPTAAALSFLLMAGILISILVYARALGTDELTGGR